MLGEIHEVVLTYACYHYSQLDDTSISVMQQRKIQINELLEKQAKKHVTQATSISECI